MKAFSKRVLSLTMAMAMVGSVVSVPNVDAEAATGLNVKSKTTYVGVATTLKLKTPSTWKSVKTTWTTNNKAVKLTAKKAKSVKVTAAKAGTATVKAKVSFKKGKKASTKTYSCKFKVAEPKLVASINKTDLKLGEEAVLTVKKKPAKGTVKYTTSDSGVVKISGGRVISTGVGTATVTVSLTTGKKVIEKKFDMTVTGSENGLTASLDNPFLSAYPSTVKAGNDAVINVSFVSNGKPVVGESVMISGGIAGETVFRSMQTATTNSKGLATFVVGNTSATAKSANFTFSVPGTDIKKEMSIDYGVISYTRVNVLNNDHIDGKNQDDSSYRGPHDEENFKTDAQDAYKDLVPGTNYPLGKGNGEAYTASMEGYWEHNVEKDAYCQTADYLRWFPHIISAGTTCHSLRYMRQEHIISGAAADYRGFISVQYGLD